MNCAAKTEKQADKKAAHGMSIDEARRILQFEEKTLPSIEAVDNVCGLFFCFSHKLASSEYIVCETKNRVER